jgi:hypothetical protein
MLGEHGKGLRNVDGLRLVAADVGTTTIAMELYDENGTVQDRFVCVNPQTEFGADVLSRIQAAQDPQKKRKDVSDDSKRFCPRGRALFEVVKGRGADGLRDRRKYGHELPDDGLGS